jgi:metallo-beta-lactamase family protein
MNITFLGAAKCVTGSCTLIETGKKKILVDCGMRQGRDAKNAPEDEFAFNAAEIDAMFLTHAHIDHSGMIPLLVKKGFTGRIYCTGATARLCSIMFPDSGHIQEMEAEWENRKRRRAGRPEIKPLYTVEDAKKAVRSLEPVDYGEKETALPGITARFVDAGHLLGSASIELFIEEDGKKKKLVFSGDIGNKNRPIINDPVYIDNANIVFMESTYGDRLHMEPDTREELIRVLKKAVAKGGNIVIPSFAVGRTQEVLYDISVLLEENLVPGLEKVPVYIDSPLGIAATEIFESSSKGYYDEEAMAYKAEGVKFFSFDTLNVAQTVDESKAINFDKRQKIIISSSGMCEAGRIKHHLKHNLWKEDSTILFVGYQAIGTLGRSILEGRKSVKIFGEEIQVKADIEQIEGFSGHADREGLLEWIGHFPASVERVFVMHGEDEVAEKFAGELKKQGYNAHAPELYETFDTDTFEQKAARPVSAEAPAADLEIKNVIEKLREEIEKGGLKQAEKKKRELLALLGKWESEQTA